MIERLFPTFGSLWRLVRGPGGPQRGSAAVLRLLAVCRETGLDPAPLLTAWARDERGMQGARVARAAALLAEGATLPDVLRRVPRLVTADDGVALEFGERIGRLPEVVAATVAPEHSADTVRGLRAGLGYIAVVALVTGAVALLLGIRVLPQFRKILDDFGIDGPPALERGAVAIEWAASLLGGLVLLGLVALVVAMIPPLRRVCGRVFGGPVARPRRTAQALDLLAVATAAGMPEEQSLRALADCESDAVLARRLRAAAASAGPDRLSRARLVAPAEARFAAAAADAGSGAWGLATLAAMRRRRGAGRVRLAGQLLFPAAAAVMGGFVLVVALAVFVPLIRMIQDLS